MQSAPSTSSPPTSSGLVAPTDMERAALATVNGEAVAGTYMSMEDALRVVANYLRPMVPKSTRPNICDWAEHNYYLAPGSYEGAHPTIPLPITLLPHQKSILNFGFHNPTIKFVNFMYSTVKKSGKTAIGGLVARYLAETSGSYAEVYALANDEEQARGRIYKAAVDSIENSPGWDKERRTLYGSGAAANTPIWRIIERQAEHIPTHSFLKALSNDYRGEAGANPTATIWSEIWGLNSESMRKLWAELTPVPTRQSVRFVETYAGFEGESYILERLWDLATKADRGARRLTRDEMPDWPFEGDIPCFVNESARMFAYVDQGEEARRMPWQTTSYYAEQEANLEPWEYDRFHRNWWVTSIAELFPIQWFKNCIVPTTPPHMQKLTRSTPLVLGIDAASTSDYMALVVCSREAERSVAIRFCQVWRPEDYGGKLNYRETLFPTIELLIKRYNIVEIAYDPWQMHLAGDDLENIYYQNCYPFQQKQERAKADKQLHDMVRDRRLLVARDSTDPDIPMDIEALEKAIRGAAKKIGKEEDSNYRIVKRASDSKIDALIATSMAADRTLYNNLW